MGTLSRRQVGKLLGTGAVGAVLTACGGTTNALYGGSDADAEPAATDFSARFAGFEVADEPNGDLSKAVWPEFVTKAGPEVKQLYEFQITHGELMRWMPCFCGCGQSAGHRNNRDCYVQAVNPDGSVVFDAMAPTWGICLGVTRAVIEMQAQGMTPRAMRAAIDAQYADQIDLATPTPYPPA